jgi:hypothetical protein
MADGVNLQLECALDCLLSITEKSGNLRKDLKRNIADSVSTLRSIFVVMKSREEEHKGKITQLESEVKKVTAELQECRAVTLTPRMLPSVGGIGKPPATSLRQGQPPTGGARKLYSEVMSTRIEKRYKLMVRLKTNERQRQLKMF